ncbi:hypothetical protein PJI16_06940 [Nitrospira sp. MA-1]|nr:hypothetical protein [Nitrospira sp. MA-1]
MNNSLIAVWFLLLMTISNIIHASERGTYSDSPRLPEPMVFDLVLPLGAHKNEYEFNALSQYNFKDDAMRFNPEFEYAFADGYGIEFELPMQNGVVKAYKLGLQGTFDFLRNSRFIHGWQYIGEYHRHLAQFEDASGEFEGDPGEFKGGGGFENDLLYVFGYQFNRHWSMLNMTGLRLTDIGSHGHLEGLVNGNLIYSFSKKFHMGLEMNWESRPKRPDLLLVMPQLHVRLAKHAKIQFGFGMERTEHQNFSVAAARVIFGF